MTKSKMMQNDSTPGTAAHPVPSPASAKLPRWVTCLLVLQSLTLVGVLSSQSGPSATAAERTLFGQQDNDRVGGPPNAAEQRRQQLQVLEQIVTELKTANAHLVKIDGRLQESAATTRASGTK